MTRVKICGLITLEDIEIANELMPDFIGFVFAKSRRQIDFERARILKNALSPQIKAVGVFVDESIELIQTLCENSVIDMVQLHGKEDENYIYELKKSINIPIIKAVRVKNRDEILKAEKLPCDYLLLDAYVEGEMGGSGKMFDHRIIPKLKKPFFLAGGLNSQNVASAIEIAKPFAVDVSSGVEQNQVKSKQLIKDFIDIVSGLVI